MRFRAGISKLYTQSARVSTLRSVWSFQGLDLRCLMPHRQNVSLWNVAPFP